MNSNGKGSKPRPYNVKMYDANFDYIFRKGKRKKMGGSFRKMGGPYVGRPPGHQDVLKDQ
jgi:hypothetical protein